MKLEYRIPRSRPKYDRYNGIIVVFIAPDIVSRVGHSETPPFRPRLPTDGKSADVERYIKLMLDCWADNAVDRPDIAAVKRSFGSIHNMK